MTHTRDNQWHDGESAEHRANCASCREEQELLDSALNDFRESARRAAARPDYGWDRQRLAILDSLRSARRSRGHGNLWLWASATVLVISVLTLFVPRGEPMVPDIAAGQDQELLTAVERSLNREVPRALEPALILTEELNDAATRATRK